MILGALVDAGADARELVNQLALLGLNGYEIEFERVDRSGISAMKAHVRVPHEHKHRHLKDIVKIIDESRLNDSIKDRAKEIFRRLAEAEARVHGIEIGRVHFHEVGAMDAILDVVGACIGFELLGIERFAASALHTGSGMVEMAHGKFPIPPPAVVELTKNAPTCQTEIVGELLTPTGAAIITSVCESFGAMPALLVERTGYGAGTKNYEKFPNVLRVLIGERQDRDSEKESNTKQKNESNSSLSNAFKSEKADGATTEKLLMIETNVDDATGQVVGHLMELAFSRGALDCYFTPVQMKKNRPGVVISILCRLEDKEAMFELLFSETTTLGVRFSEVERLALARQTISVETRFGAIEFKLKRFGGRVVGGTPEYEHLCEAAERAGVSLLEVETAARAAFERVLMTLERTKIED